jgi:hypothetical protein
LSFGKGGVQFSDESARLLGGIFAAGRAFGKPGRKILCVATQRVEQHPRTLARVGQDL